MSNDIIERIDKRVVEGVNYTVYNEIVTQLLDVTKGPITMVTCDDNVIFNHQCYDKKARCKQITGRLLPLRQQMMFTIFYLPIQIVS